MLKAEAIIRQASEFGIENIGIIPVAVMDEYWERVNERIDRLRDGMSVYGWLLPKRLSVQVPWAKAIIVAAVDMAHYRLPAALRDRVGKYYQTAVWSVSAESRKKAEFEAYLQKLPLKVSSEQVMGLRWAGLKAGLGLVRRNNFFYGPGGSYQWLWGWAIDKNLEYFQNTSLQACPEKCSLCMKACPTAALAAPYVMDMSICVTRLSIFNGFLKPADPLNGLMGGWLYGCDACQDACPWNDEVWRESDELPGLEELAAWLEPERLLAMSREEMSRILKSISSYYMEEKDLWKWKVNALNLMANSYRPEYETPLRLALNDPEARVREKAAYVLAQVSA